MNVIFEVFPYLFGIMFVTIFIIFVSILLSNLARKKQDDASPRLAVPAQVVSRRTDTPSSFATAFISAGTDA